MPYVTRNHSGKVVGLAGTAVPGCHEQLELEHPDVQEFLEAARDALSTSDNETIRVIEDLVDILISKKVIMLTDLPAAAQQKLTERQRMRSEISSIGYLVVDEKDIL